MYGMIHIGIKELVVEKFGEKKWEEICKGAQIQDDQFSDLQYYPDQITYNLVGSASKVLGLPAEAVLQEFGKYWVTHTANVGYGPIMDMFGNTFVTCLQNLNSLHARMGISMPDLKPPRFELIEIGPNHYNLEYYSIRKNLDKMVVGLLMGLAEKFNTKIQVENITNDSDAVPQLYKVLVET